MIKPPMCPPIPKRHFLDRSRIKPYPQKRLKPSDLGYGMTVCIAAMGGNDPFDEYVVSAADSMLSFAGGTVTADGLAYKKHVLAKHWNVLMAGDISEAMLIVDRIRRETLPTLDSIRDERNVVDIMRIAVESYKARLNERIQNEILGPYGLKLGESGLQDYPDIRSRIDWLASRDFDPQLLIFGFDRKDDVPVFDTHLLSIHSPGDVSSHDRPGFWAIGSGADLALSSLAFAGQNFSSSLEQTIWNVCVAKFRAEHASGVGKQTEVWITNPDKPRLYQIDDSVIDKAREAFEVVEKNQLRVPKGIRDFAESVSERDKD